MRERGVNRETVVMDRDMWRVEIIVADTTRGG